MKDYAKYVASDLIPIRVIKEGKRVELIIAKQFCQEKAMKLLGICTRSIQWNEHCQQLEVFMN